MKKSFFLLAIIFFCSIAFGQSQLIVQSNEKGLFVNHTVTAKENFYSIGRLYNISPKEIAAFNNVDMSLGLNIGQVLYIPLSTNFSQSVNSGTPVYYVVGDKEGLYRVSVKNKEVLMANLRKWNNLSNDNISTGQKLIVGFITANGQSTVANNVTNEVKQEVVKTEPPVQKEVEKPVVQKPVEEKPKPVQVSNMSVSADGYFKTQFEQQSRTNGSNKDQTVTSGIFKTASGWQDGKYYALIDNIEPGTIIRIINPSNNKAVYAKVLGEMSGIRQNQGYEMRISNAAATVLNVSDTEKFIVRLTY